MEGFAAADGELWPVGQLHLKIRFDLGVWQDTNSSFATAGGFHAEGWLAR